MENDISSILEPLISLLGEGIYEIFSRKVIKKVVIGKEELISNRDLVKLKMVEATNRTEKVNDDVLEWLNDAEKFIEEVEELEIEMETHDRADACFAQPRVLGGEKKYRLYKGMLKKIKRLNAKCEFEPFSTPISGLEYFSSEYFVSFNSTKEASDQLMKALKDDSNHIIGLYGKRGSGKTKLVEVVGKKAKCLMVFNEVIFATVSQNANNVRRIQDQIADSLDLTFERYSEAARARTISSKIESKGRVLVILDDVREKLELKDLGIPINGNRCKVLLTTRSQQECTLMDCQREIPLCPLSEEEAWALLKKHSDIDDESSSDLLTVARELANECQGLLGTIKDVGSSLQCQPIEEWKALIDSLRHSARYQIFLSFRGDDTRYSFTGSLYDALCREGFKTFMDDGGLEGGDQISQTLITAIEASRLSIIVLSENYAKSAWCLDELVKIVECRKTKNQLVWPIFYKVEPSDVRYQKNSYGEAMVAHENRFVNESEKMQRWSFAKILEYMKIKNQLVWSTFYKAKPLDVTYQKNNYVEVMVAHKHKFVNDYEKIQKWRSALFEIAGLSAMAYSNGYEYKFIQTIVERAKNNKNRLYLQSTYME